MCVLLWMSLRYSFFSFLFNAHTHSCPHNTTQHTCTHSHAALLDRRERENNTKQLFCQCARLVKQSGWFCFFGNIFWIILKSFFRCVGFDVFYNDFSNGAEDLCAVYLGWAWDTFFFFNAHVHSCTYNTTHMHAHTCRKPSSILRQGPKTIRDNCETLTVQRTKLDFEHGFQTVK